MNLDPDEQIFADAIEVANIPTLLMVIVQLTGELEWLEAPYTPKRQPGLGDNDSGGLDPRHQREVREAALEAILAWRAGRAVALPEPDEELIVRMLSVSMAETVPSEYGQFTAAQLGQVKFLDHEPVNAPVDFKVLVIGAGMYVTGRGVENAAGVIMPALLEARRNGLVGKFSEWSWFA